MSAFDIRAIVHFVRAVTIDRRSPVSYTHLDVYKRQAWPRGSAVAASERRPSRWLRLSMVTALTKCTIARISKAVSYTHLDVYKRQGQKLAGLLAALVFQ